LNGYFTEEPSARHMARSQSGYRGDQPTTFYHQDENFINEPYYQSQMKRFGRNVAMKRGGYPAAHFPYQRNDVPDNARYHNNPIRPLRF
jgi:hypothetical protein